MIAPLFQPLSQPDRQRCEELIALLQSEPISVSQTRQLNEELGEELARLVLSSASLQTKAVSKLGVGLWWATEKSLQQATPCHVAQLKAGWFGDGTVYDLCCGLGGDAIQLAKQHQVIGVDHDTAVCTIAHENVRRHAPGQAEIVQQDVTKIAIPSDAWVHLDPDRRAAERRSTDPDQYSPPWQDVAKIFANARGGLAKLAPAAVDVALPRDDVHRVWISLAGSVREQSLLVGETVDRFCSAAKVESLPNAASAVVLSRDQVASYFCPSEKSQNVAVAPSAGEPIAWMVDPDAAIRSAGLTETFANQFGLKTLGGPSGFLTGVIDRNKINGLAISEPILWHGSCDDRKLRRELRTRGCYPWRVKTRGVSQDPNLLEKKLRDCGSQPCTLWIGKNGKRRYAVLTEKISKH